MADVTVITNNVPRDIVHAYELPIDVRDDFDYLDWTSIEMGVYSTEFVRYKGNWYDLGDLEHTNMPPTWMEGWDAFISDTFFSGVLFKYVNDYEQIVMGRFYC